MPTSAPVKNPQAEAWYVDWQNPEHVRLFDGRALLADAPLVKNYEVLNDVRLLKESFGPKELAGLLEIGCATGEFYRYLRIRYPKARYVGMDISQVAIQRAKEKYPGADFYVTDPDLSILEGLQAFRWGPKQPVVYSKDVLHHQVDPWRFLAQLLEVTETALILRTRTRDQGKTVLDPDRSCQYHYKGWMPYLVLNLQELIDFIRSRHPECHLIVYRNRMVLGGKENRFLPKECYLPETGTAETAVGVFLKTQHPGRILVKDRIDQNPTGSLRHRLRRAAGRVLSPLK